MMSKERIERTRSVATLIATSVSMSTCETKMRQYYSC